MYTFQKYKIRNKGIGFDLIQVRVTLHSLNNDILFVFFILCNSIILTHPL